MSYVSVQVSLNDRLGSSRGGVRSTHTRAVRVREPVCVRVNNTLGEHVSGAGHSGPSSCASFSNAWPTSCEIVGNGCTTC